MDVNEWYPILACSGGDFVMAVIDPDSARVLPKTG